MTLKWRIALTLAAVALAVGAIAGTSAWLTTSSQLRGAIDGTLRASATALNSQDGDHGGRGPGQPNDQRCPPPGSFQGASAAQIVETSGAIDQCIDGGVSLPAEPSNSLQTVAIGGQQYRVLSTPWHDGGSLQVARSLAETDQVLSRLRLELALLIAVTTLLTAVLGWGIASRIAKPISRLRDSAERIARTLDFSAPVVVGGTGEVRSLGRSFTTMVGAVRQSHEQQRRLVSDASHEMRTPLTSLRSNVELLGKIERLPEHERAEVVNDVLEDIDELANLLGELVDLASDLSAAEPTEPTSLVELAEAVANRTERRLTRTVNVVDAGAIQVIARPRQLERALSNLVDNAVKYSGAGTPIDITIERTTVTVADRGRGIRAEDLDRIFDRFFRATEVRTDPGSGLGLAIVDEIVRGHGGTVFAANREGGGAAIGFTLPVETR